MDQCSYNSLCRIMVSESYIKSIFIQFVKFVKFVNSYFSVGIIWITSHNIMNVYWRINNFFDRFLIELIFYELNELVIFINITLPVWIERYVIAIILLSFRDELVWF